MSESSDIQIDRLVQWDLLDDPSIIEQCRNQLKLNGVMVLPNFATTDGLRSLLNEIQDAPYNEIRIRQHTAWQDQGDKSYPNDHPRNFMVTSSVAFVGRQTLEKTCDRLGLSLYMHQDRILNFVSKVAQRRLYRSEDVNGSCYTYRIHPDHKPEWHYDESPYTAILYLKNNGNLGGGGEFELVPWSRTTTSKHDTDGHETVRKVLMEGDFTSVRSIPATPGSLVFFSGSRSLHRAAPIKVGVSEGEEKEKSEEMMRLGLVFTFGEKEGFCNSDDVKDNNKWDPNDH